MVLNVAPAGSQSLQTLNLARNRLGPQAVLLLCESLKDHTGLRKLDLSNNYLGDEGAMTLAKLLEKRKKF